MNSTADVAPINARLQHLHTIAMRRTFTPDEADDLVQDVVLAALTAGRALDDPGFPAWAAGVLRRRALFVARTAGRRRRREAEYAGLPRTPTRHERKLPRHFIDSLPPSLQLIALLVNAGLGRAEISILLRIPETALRQRISGLRRAWRRAGMEADITVAGDDAEANGPRRRALKNTLARVPNGRLAISDPDGHPIFFGGAAHDRGGRGNQ